MDFAPSSNPSMVRLYNSPHSLVHGSILRPCQCLFIDFVAHSRNPKSEDMGTYRTLSTVVARSLVTGCSDRVIGSSEPESTHTLSKWRNLLQVFQHCTYHNQVLICKKHNNKFCRRCLCEKGDHFKKINKSLTPDHHSTYCIDLVAWVGLV